MRILLIVFLLTIFSLNIHAEGFIAGFEDIPLMNGAKQIEDETFAFGNEETRYIEARAILPSKANFNDVKKFYKNVLVQLGWKEQKNRSNSINFERENDILEISAIVNSPLKISIVLKSKN